MEKVVVGLSGGVDSFVTALLLQQRGYEVIGVTLALWKENELAEVEAVCRKLKIPLLLRDGRELFRRIIVAPFIDSYLHATTPCPCCLCNSYVKWALLDQVAWEVGATRIATGHYVRIIRKDGLYYICRGIDLHKDQSYFLWGAPHAILAKAITPLGDFTKIQVKNWASEQGYQRLAAKKESMGICFLEGKDYREFIQGYLGEEKTETPGDILDRQGRLLGKHHGLLHYTIGQKRGIPSHGGQAFYVAEIDEARNIIIADTKSGLLKMSLKIGQTHISCHDDLQATDITVKIRGIGLNPQGFVSIEKLLQGHLRIHLSDPAWAVAPGQPVALYRGDRLIGGGIVEREKCDV